MFIDSHVICHTQSLKFAVANRRIRLVALDCVSSSQSAPPAASSHATPPSPQIHRSTFQRSPSHHNFLLEDRTFVASRHISTLRIQHSWPVVQKPWDSITKQRISGQLSLLSESRVDVLSASHPSSREGLIPRSSTTLNQTFHNNDINMEEIPMTQVSSHASSTWKTHDDDGMYRKEGKTPGPLFSPPEPAGRRKLKVNSRQKDEENGEMSLTGMGKFYDKIVNFSVFTRYLVPCTVRLCPKL